MCLGMRGHDKRSLVSWRQLEKGWIPWLGGGQILDPGHAMDEVRESEFESSVKCALAVLVARSMGIDFGYIVCGTEAAGLSTDSSTGCIMERRGAVGICHLHCLVLWVQNELTAANWNYSSKLVRATPRTLV